MKDFLGRELKVGDTVVYQTQHYHSLAIAKITKIGNKMVTLDVTCGYHSKPMSEAKKNDRPLTRYAGDCVKVEGQND